MLDFEERANFYKNSINIPGVNFDVACYVEDEVDVIFWADVFDSNGLNLNPKFFYYTRAVFSDDIINDERGKNAVLKYLPYADEEFILCIDSDYDLLTKSDNPNIVNWIFQTYTHSIENYKCYAPTLMDVCLNAVQSTNRNLFDIEKFFADYSTIIYPLFIVFILSERKAPYRFLENKEFSKAIALRGNFDIKNNGEKELEVLKGKVNDELDRLSVSYSEQEFTDTEQHIQSLGMSILPKNTALFVRGHTLYNRVTLPTLRSISNVLLNNKIKESGLININSSEAVKEKLSINTNFYNCFLMDKIRLDINIFKSKTNPTQ